MTDATGGHGRAPRGGWARLVPELYVESLEASLDFWCGPLGFAIAYRRPEERFAFLEHADGPQVMLCQRCGMWETGPMERPFGRGLLLQVYLAELAPVERRLAEGGWPLYAGPREVWRRWGDREGGKREIFVQDPDGFLLMLAEDLGERPLAEEG
jgi:catechol 2,3-dioxygenase-like lactoylglutathione lyase family enzyme